MSEFCLSVRVYYEDTDAGGLVYHSNYLKYMERARSEYLRELGYTHLLLAQQEKLVFVVSQINIDYKKPARLDDTLAVSVAFDNVQGASLTCLQTVRRDADILCIGTVRIACLDSDTHTPKKIPSPMKAKFNHDY
ncbi:MAG: tol-pal system-associated acyl-CoA thioesterase [Gammaproteobacteria bacterium]